MNLNLPFKLALAMVPGPMQGRVRVTLQPSPPEPGEMLERDDYAGALGLLDLFAQCVNAQMFLPETSTRACALAVEFIDWQAQHGRCEMLATAHNLPVFAWVHLLALLKKNHDALETLDWVQIQVEDVSTVLPPAAIQASLPPSNLHADYPFELEHGGVDKRKNIRIELEFHDPLATDNASTISARLQLWLECIVLGGFDLSFAEAEELDPMGHVKQVSPVRIACFVPYYGGDHSGFEALLRIAMDVHRTIQSLSAVSIE